MARKMTITEPSAPSEFQLEMADFVNIYVNNRSIQCKRRILSRVSSYLEEQSRVASSENKQLRICVDSEVAEEFSQHLITGRNTREIHRETLNLLTFAAHKHKLPILLRKCERIYLSQLIPMNCLENLLFAETHGCETLANKALAMAIENFEEISKTNQFCHIGKFHLLKLVNNYGLKVGSEGTVFNAIRRWTEYEENVRAKDVEEMCRQVSEVFKKRTSRAALGTITPRTRNHSYSEVSPPKRRKSVVRQNQDFEKDVPQIPSVTSTTTVPAPTIACLCSTDGKMNMITVTFSENKPEITGQIPVPHLSRDSAFCHTFDGIYASGGYQKSDGTEFFDHKTNQWTKLPKMFYFGRWDHSLCQVNDRLYALGGVSSNTGRVIEFVDKYNIQKQKWTSAGKLEEPVKSAQSLAFEKDIFVFGGVRPDESHSKSVQCYNTITKKSEIVCRIPTDDNVLKAVSDRNLIYLVTSNKTVLEFNPSSKNFQTLSSLKSPMVNFGIFHHNGFLYIFGGKRKDGQKTEQHYAEVHRLDLRDRDAEWKHMGSLPRELTVISSSEAMFGIG